MEISEETKTYLNIFFKLLFGLALLIILFTFPKFSCEDYANRFRQEFNCNLILTNKEFENGVGTLYGIDLVSKKQISSIDYSKWLYDNFDKLNLGDTVIKKKGEFTIVIKRKGQIFKILFQCGNKVFKDN